MAKNGSFKTTGFSDPSCPDHYIFSWSLNSQDIEKNESIISWSLKGAGGSTSDRWTNVKEKYVTVNGTTQSNSTIKATKNGTTPFSGASTIKHKSDGTGSFSASAGGAFYYYGSYNSTGSGTWTLPTIARASTLTSAGNVTLGKPCNVKWTPKNKNFKYKLKFSLGSWSHTTGFITPDQTSAYTYDDYTIPAISAIYNLIPNSTTGTMSVALTTYTSDDNQIGSSSTKTFTVTIPSTVKPKMGSMSLDPVNVGGKNILLQNKNKINVKISGCTPGDGTGTTIKSYTVSGPGITSVTKSSSESEITIAVGPVETNGDNLTYKATVKDSRGRSAYITKNITCYAYKNPSIKNFQAYRATSDGKADVDGKYLKCTYSTVYSGVGGANSITVKATYTTGTTSKTATCSNNQVLIKLGENEKTYKVYLTITDTFGGSNTSPTKLVHGSLKILNVSSSGTGVAIGKMATKNSLFDSRWAIKTDEPEKTMQNLTYKGSNLLSTSKDTVPNWANLGNLGVVYYNQDGKINGQPYQYGYLLNVTAGPGSTQVHQLWMTQRHGSLYHRGGNEASGFDEWDKILDSSNYTDYVSKKAVKLYSKSSGNDGTVTLSQSAEDFTYLEIFYTDNHGRQTNSVKVYSPNGKYVTLSCTEPSTSNAQPRVYIRTSGWTISGKSMTVGRSDLEGKNRGVYAQIYKNAGGTNIDVSVSEKNYIKIVRVLGYK